MNRAKIEIDIGEIQFDSCSVGMAFLADSTGSAFLMLTAENIRERTAVSMVLDSQEYERFKSLFKVAEEAIRDLRAHNWRLPKDIISLPMKLAITVGSVSHGGVCALVTINIPSNASLAISLYVVDTEGNDGIPLELYTNQYQQFKGLLHSTDDTLARLYSSRQIPSNFLACR